MLHLFLTVIKAFDLLKFENAIVSETSNVNVNVRSNEISEYYIVNRGECIGGDQYSCRKLAHEFLRGK